MPNQGNRSNGSKTNKGRGITGDAERKTSSSKPNPERSDIKHSSDNNGGTTGRTSSQGRKNASGGS